jgi:hypothetical protein
MFSQFPVEENRPHFRSILKNSAGPSEALAKGGPAPASNHIVWPSARVNSVPAPSDLSCAGVSATKSEAAARAPSPAQVLRAAQVTRVMRTCLSSYLSF